MQALLFFRANQEVVAEAFMPTLKALFAAPGTSPLIEVKVIKVAELLVQLSNARHRRSATATDSTVLQVGLITQLSIDLTYLCVIVLYLSIYKVPLGCAVV